MAVHCLISTAPLLLGLFASFSVQYRYGGPQDPRADVDTEGGVDLGLPEMVEAGKLLLHPRPQGGHLLGRAAVGHSQIVPLVLPAPLDRQGHQLVDDLMAPPDLGHGGQ